MTKAVLSHGEIRPLEPLPTDWVEGQSLQIEKADDNDREMSTEEIKRDFAILESLCATNDPADEERLEQALQKAERESKEQVRREMGLA